MPDGHGAVAARVARSRRIGVELEFGGLTEDRTAEVIAATLGGTVRPGGPRAIEVEDTAIGGLTVYLDTALRTSRSDLVRAGVDLARPILPVEVVTEPLPLSAMDRLETLVTALRYAGAEGSRDGMFLGFGLHLNVETTGRELADILPVMRAYGLIEDHLRATRPIDISRRVMPFVDPWPRVLVDRLAAGEIGDMGALIDLYLDCAASRNYGLDVLPILADIAPDRVRAALPDAKIAPRPAWHFRLPDCLVDEPGWRILDELDRWWLVERVAGDRGTLDRLAAGWKAHRDSLFTIRPDWAETAAEILSDRFGGGAS